MIIYAPLCWPPVYEPEPDSPDLPAFGDFAQALEPPAEDPPQPLIPPTPMTTRPLRRVAFC